MNICMNRIASDDLDAFKEFSASTRESAIAFALEVRRRKSMKKAFGGDLWQNSVQAQGPTKKPQ